MSVSCCMHEPEPTNPNRNEPEPAFNREKRAGQASGQARRQAGHDRRQANGEVCKRCWICFPQTGKSPSRTKVLIQPEESLAIKLHHAVEQAIEANAAVEAAATSQPEAPAPIHTHPPPPSTNVLTFREWAWGKALAGTSAAECATLRQIPLIMFLGEVQETFKESWDSVCARAKLEWTSKTKEVAIRDAMSGDIRSLIVLLQKSDLFGQTGARDLGKGNRLPTTMEEVEERIKVLEEKRKTPIIEPLTIDQIPLQVPTVIRDQQAVTQ